MKQWRELSDKETRKVSLLASLRDINGLLITPRMTELIRFNDPREHIPPETKVARRKMIRDLVERGYMVWVNDNAGHPVRLAITVSGVDYLTHIGR